MASTCEERGIVHMKDIFQNGRFTQRREKSPAPQVGGNTRTFRAQSQNTTPLSHAGNTNRPTRKAPSPPPLRKTNDVRSGAVYTAPKHNVNDVSGGGGKRQVYQQQDTSASISPDNPVRPPRSKKRLAPQPPGPSQPPVTRREPTQLSPSASTNKSDFRQSLAELVVKRQSAGPPPLGLPPRPPSPGIPYELPPPLPSSPPYVPGRKGPPPPGPPPPPPGPPPPPPVDRLARPPSPGYAKKIIPPFNPAAAGVKKPQSPPPPPGPPPPPPPLRPTSPPARTASPERSSRQRYASPRRPYSPSRTTSPVGRATSPRRATSPASRPLSPPPPPPSPFRDMPPVKKMDKNHNFAKDAETESSLLSQHSEHGSSGYHSEFEADNDTRMKNTKKGEVGEEEFTVTFDESDSEDTGFSEPSPKQKTPHSPHPFIYKEYQGEDFSQYLKDDTEPPIPQERYLTEKRYRKRKGSAGAMSGKESQSSTSTLQKKIGLRDRLSKVFTLTKSQKRGVPRNRPASNIHTFSYTDSKSYDHNSDVEDMIPDTRSDFGATASYWNRDTLSARTLRRKAQSELAYNSRSESDLTFATSGYVSDTSDGYSSTKERKSKKFGFFKKLGKKRRPSQEDVNVTSMRQFSVRPPSVEDIRL